MKDLWRLIYEYDSTYNGQPRTFTKELYFDTEEEAREYTAYLYGNQRLVSIELYHPRFWWIVEYDYTASRYFDSPLRRRKEREAFDTYQEALAWSKAPHPDMPNFCTLNIFKEYEIIHRGHITGVMPGSAEARRNSDHNTDVSILGF